MLAGANRAAVAAHRPGVHPRRTGLDRSRVATDVRQPADVRRSDRTQRPEEWQALERSDIDRSSGTLTVRRTVSSGEVVESGKTERSRRQVPLTQRAVTALDTIPPRLDTRLIYSAPHGGVLNLDNFRRRTWAPAIEAAGIARPASASTTCARRLPVMRSPQA